MRRIGIVALQVALLSGCFKALDTTDAPCPCTLGYQCCQALNVCRPLGASCGIDGPKADGGGGDAGVAFDLRPLSAKTDGAGATSAWMLGGAWGIGGAALGTSGNALYVSASFSGATCAEPRPTVLPLTLSRFEVDGGTLALSWTVPFENTGDAVGTGVAASSDGVTLVGGTSSGSILGQTERGDGDAFIARFSPTGHLNWVHQIGSIDTDWLAAVLALPDGTVVVGGSTRGALEAGHLNATGSEIFLARFDANGGQLWLHQYPFGEGVVQIAPWGNDLLILTMQPSASADPQSVERHRALRVSTDGEVRWVVTDGATGSRADAFFGDGPQAWLHGFAFRGDYHYDLYEERWSEDGGVTPATNLGPWPAETSGLSNFTLTHRPDGAWYAACAGIGGKIVTVTRHSPRGAREETRRWLFDDPALVSSTAGYGSIVTPLQLAVMQDGTVGMVGDVLLPNCDAQRSLWLMAF